MSDFFRFFRAECVKWRRDWTLLVMLLAPITQAGFLLLIVWFSEYRVNQFGAGFRVWYMVNYIAWNCVFMPVSAALLAALSWDLEGRSRAWRLILIQPVPNRVHFLVKLLNQFVMMTLSQVLLATLLILGGLVLRAYVPPLSMGPMRLDLLLHFALFSFIASLPVLCLHTWVSSRINGLGASLALAIGGTWAAFQFTGNAIWLPWGLAAQILGMTLKAQPISAYMYSGAVLVAVVLIGLGTLDFAWRINTRGGRGL